MGKGPGRCGRFVRPAALAAVVALCMVPVAAAADPSPDPAPDPRPKAASAPAPSQSPSPSPSPKPVYTPPPEPTYTPPPEPTYTPPAAVSSSPPVRAAPVKPKPKPKSRAKQRRARAKPHRVAPRVVVTTPTSGPAVSGVDLVPNLATAPDPPTAPPADGMGVFWSLALVAGGVLVAMALLPARSRFRPVVAIGHVRVQLFAIGCSVLGGALLPLLLR
jgi:hypothetical protein